MKSGSSTQKTFASYRPDHKTHDPFNHSVPCPGTPLLHQKQKSYFTKNEDERHAVEELKELATEETKYPLPSSIPNTWQMLMMWPKPTACFPVSTEFGP